MSYVLLHKLDLSLAIGFSISTNTSKSIHHTLLFQYEAISLLFHNIPRVAQAMWSWLQILCGGKSVWFLKLHQFSLNSKLKLSLTINKGCNLLFKIYTPYPFSNFRLYHYISLLSQWLHNFFYPIYFYPQLFLVPHFFRPKFFWTQIFWAQILLPKKIWQQFLPKNISVPKFFWTQKFFWDLQFLRTQNIFNTIFSFDQN